MRFTRTRVREISSSRTTVRPCLSSSVCPSSSRSAICRVFTSQPGSMPNWVTTGPTLIWVMRESTPNEASVSTMIPACRLLSLRRAGGGSGFKMDNDGICQPSALRRCDGLGLDVRSAGGFGSSANFRASCAGMGPLPAPDAAASGVPTTAAPAAVVLAVTAEPGAVSIASARSSRAALPATTGVAAVSSQGSAPLRRGQGSAPVRPGRRGNRMYERARTPGRSQHMPPEGHRSDACAVTRPREANDRAARRNQQRSRQRRRGQHDAA